MEIQRFVKPDGFCKVCKAFVPKRKKYQPSTCEACQKFFRRNFAKRKLLICRLGFGGCIVDYTMRRQCHKCRLEKCVIAGMKTQSSSDSDEQTVNIVAPVVRDPVFFDGPAIERTLKSVTKAFTELHDLEFLPMKRPNQVDYDRDGILEIALQQIAYAQETSLRYLKTLADFEGLPASSVTAQLVRFACDASIACSSLPNCASGLFGAGINLLQPIMQNFPELEQLKSEMHLWNPSFIESALLIGLLLFDESVPRTMPKLARVRRRMWFALSLCQNLGEEDIIAQNRRHFEQSIKLTRDTTRAIISVVSLVALHEPQFNKHLVIPEENVGDHRSSAVSSTSTTTSEQFTMSPRSGTC